MLVCAPFASHARAGLTAAPAEFDALTIKACVHLGGTLDGRGSVRIVAVAPGRGSWMDRRGVTHCRHDEEDLDWGVGDARPASNVAGGTGETDPTAADDSGLMGATGPADSDEAR